jgi:hypothetical protein
VIGECDRDTNGESSIFKLIRSNARFQLCTDKFECIIRVKARAKENTINGCRCNERLNVKTEGSKHLVLG